MKLDSPVGMPQLIKTTLINTHKNGLIIIGTLLVISLMLAIYKYNLGYITPGNWRVIFWFVTIYINYKLIGKIDRRITASLMMFSCYLSFYIYPLLPIQTNYGENLFLLPSTLIVFSVLPYLIFDINKEKIWIASWVAILVVTFWISINYTLTQIDIIKYSGLLIVFKNYTMLAVAFIVSWLFIQIMFYKYLKNIATQQKRIMEVNTTLDEKVLFINEQNSALDEQSNELMKLQEQIITLNNELEFKVKQRTKELEIQTEALNKYGFVNSNLVRGPIESILKSGNIDISSTLDDIESLNSIMQDLDAITKAISDVLNMQNMEGIKAVEDMIKSKYHYNE